MCDIVTPLARFMGTSTLTVLVTLGAMYLLRTCMSPGCRPAWNR